MKITIQKRAKNPGSNPIKNLEPTNKKDLKYNKNKPVKQHKINIKTTPKPTTNQS